MVYYFTVTTTKQVLLHSESKHSQFNVWNQFWILFLNTTYSVKFNLTFEWQQTVDIRFRLHQTSIDNLNLDEMSLSIIEFNCSIVSTTIKFEKFHLVRMKMFIWMIYRTYDELS